MGDTERMAILRTLDRSEMLFSPEEVDQAYQRLADWVLKKYQGNNCPVLLTVLNGGLRIASELMKRLPFPMELESIRVARYGSGVKAKELSWFATPKLPLAGKDILLVDEILDQGRTLREVQKYLRTCNIGSLLTLVLVRRVTGKPAEAVADAVGIAVEGDRFLVGEGMDLAGYGRNLRGIWALHPQDAEKYK